MPIEDDEEEGGFEPDLGDVIFEDDFDEPSDPEDEDFWNDFVELLLLDGTPLLNWLLDDEEDDWDFFDALKMEEKI